MRNLRLADRFTQFTIRMIRAQISASDNSGHEQKVLMRRSTPRAPADICELWPSRRRRDASRPCAEQEITPRRRPYFEIHLYVAR